MEIGLTSGPSAKRLGESQDGEVVWVYMTGVGA